MSVTRQTTNGGAMRSKTQADKKISGYPRNKSIGKQHLQDQAVGEDQLQDGGVTPDKLSASAKPFDIQDYTAIGSIGNASQQYAGHQPELAEPGTLSSEVLGLWLFGAGGGLITDDEKGSYNLTNTNTVIQGAGLFGGSDGAAVFNGTDQYFSHPTFLDTFPTAFAVDLWFYNNDGKPADYEALMYKYNGANESFNMGLSQTTNKVYALCYSGGSSDVVSCDTAFTDGQATGWNYLCFNWDTTNGIRIWLNSILEGQIKSRNVLPATGTGNDFGIGSQTNGGNRWDGKIAFARVRDKVLTQKDVDIGYATTYAYTHAAKVALDAVDLVPFTKEDGHADFTAQYRQPFELARYNNKIYRYGSPRDRSDGGMFNPTDELRIAGRQ